MVGAIRTKIAAVVLGISLLVFPLLANAAIAFDASSDSGAFATSPSWTHVVTGTNTILIVCMVTATPTSSDAVSAITYNGVSR